MFFLNPFIKDNNKRLVVISTFSAGYGKIAAQ